MIREERRPAVGLPSVFLNVLADVQELGVDILLGEAAIPEPVQRFTGFIVAVVLNEPARAPLRCQFGYEVLERFGS